ncbi:unnamed protein product [Closterium sp. NIES-53]
MVKLCWKRMDEVAEGVGVGGGAEHEGRGKGVPRVVVEYSYEEEEEIEEDTLRQAQGERRGRQCGRQCERPGGLELGIELWLELEERVDKRVKHIEQQAMGDDGAVGGCAGGWSGRAGAGGRGGCAGVSSRRRATGRSKKETLRGQWQWTGGPFDRAPFDGRPFDVGHCIRMARSSSYCRGLRRSRHRKSLKSTLKQCDDAVNGVTEERKLLEGARTKPDEMNGKIIEGVAAAITKASKDAVKKQLKEDLFYSTLQPESMKELKDVVRERYQEAKAGILEVLTKVMARGFRSSVGPSTRWRQEEEVAGVRSGVERRVHERSVPPSVGGYVGSPIASPLSSAHQTVSKSVEDKEVIVRDQSPLQKISEAAVKPPPNAFAPLRDKGGKGVVAGEKSGAQIESVASARKGAMQKRGAPTPSDGAAVKGVL